MKNKKALIVLFLLTIPIMATVAIALAAGAVQNGDQTQANRIPSDVFTYQGELMNGDEPETGPCDFHFVLWDSLELGSQVGVTQTLSSVPLDNGRFTVQLNDSHQFGIHPFDGSSRFLAIEVDCPSGSGAFVPLSPRQPLTPAPYSHHADKAGSVPWDGISPMPDGFADGIDDDTLYGAGTGLELITGTFQLDASYQLPQSCDSGQVVEWTGSTWGCVTPTSWEGPSYDNVIVVAKSGGAFDTVQGALDSIVDATSENRYLVWVAPGVFTETVTMKMYVDIEGAGESLTRIVSTGFSTSSQATVIAAAHTELRSLTVENIGGDFHSIPIRSSVDDFSLLALTIIGSGATANNYGVMVYGDDKHNRLQDVTILVDAQIDAAWSFGIDLYSSTGDNRTMMQDVNIRMTGSTDGEMYGILQEAYSGNSGVLTATHLMVTVNNTGPGKVVGLYSVGANARVLLTDSSISISGGDSYSAGISGKNGTTISIRNSDIESVVLALYIDADLYPVSFQVDKSKIIGGPYSIFIEGTEANVVNIGATLIDGNTFIPAETTLTCAGSYDENYANSNGFTACP